MHIQAHYISDGYLDKSCVEGQLVVILCACSGNPNKAFESLKFTCVWSIDLHKNAMKDVNHIQADWREGLSYLIGMFGKPIIIVAHPDCQCLCFNGNNVNANFGGPMHDREIHRYNQKLKAAKTIFDMLSHDAPVIMVENGRGYLMNSLLYENGKRSFVEVEPWQFTSDVNGGMEHPDNHAKATHLFSGGDINAINEFPITQFLTQTRAFPGIEYNWVEKQTDESHTGGMSAYDKRSVTSPGMAFGIARCCYERAKFVIANNTTHNVKFILDELKLHPPPKGHRCSNSLLGGKYSCNLVIDHKGRRRTFNTGFGTRCGVWDYTTGEWIYQEPTLASSRVVKPTNFLTYNDLRDTSNRVVKQPTECTVSNSAYKNSKLTTPKKAITTKKDILKRPYLCSKCKKPKKGHICNTQKLAKKETVNLKDLMDELLSTQEQVNAVISKILSHLPK